jgi:pimeloyl-ACP methyl ester carboxylesterase
MKILMRLLGVMVLAILVFALAGLMATWAPDRSVQQLSARWAQAPSQFVEVNGMQVHFRDEGPRDDPVPVVLLHGTSASLHTWDGWVEDLKSQRRIIRFDLPGFGLTGPSPTQDYSIPAYVKFVAAMMDKLGVKKFDLAGNSLGGQIAWQCAYAMPERVGKLVLVDSAGYPMQSVSVPVGFRIARMPGVKNIMEYVLPRGIVAASVRNLYGEPERITPELIDRYYDLTLREGNRKALGKRFEQVVNSDSEKIKSLKLPTLIIWGGKDRLIPPENALRFEADIAGGRLVMFEGLGHVPHEENAQATLKPVRDFLNVK